jgi:hypothetical protein
MTESQVVELWPCGYVARCSARDRRRATTIPRYLDHQERPDHQKEACDTHASELCAELKVIDRGAPLLLMRTTCHRGQFSVRSSRPCF